jgi:hypothetical protein
VWKSCKMASVWLSGLLHHVDNDKLTVGKAQSTVYLPQVQHVL